MVYIYGFDFLGSFGGNTASTQEFEITLDNVKKETMSWRKEGKLKRGKKELLACRVS